VSEQAPPTDVTAALEELGDRVGALQEEVRRLGTTSALPAAAADTPAPGSYAWVGSLDVPVRRRPQLPRLLLEALFLVAAAAAAAIADLDAVAIAGVMIGAWVLVGLIEWAASRADSRRELPIYAPAAAVPAGADPAWFSPPVEQTLLDAAAGDNVTEVTRLPPRLDDAESTMEQRLGSVPAGD
jgi:hypothetical protein